MLSLTSHTYKGSNVFFFQFNLGLCETFYILPPPWETGTNRQRISVIFLMVFSIQRRVSLDFRGQFQK